MSRSALWSSPGLILSSFIAKATSRSTFANCLAMGESLRLAEWSREMVRSLKGPIRNLLLCAGSGVARWMKKKEGFGLRTRFRKKWYCSHLRRNGNLTSFFKGL